MTERSVRPDYLNLSVSALGKYGTIAGLVLLLIGFSIARPATFATSTNMANIINQVSLAAIISAGLTAVLIAGEFDLSIGFQASLAGVLVVGLMSNQDLPPAIAVSVVLAFGCLIGLVNGLIVTKLGVNALIATLGTGTVIVGINYAYSSGIPLAIGLSSSFPQLALGTIFGIANPIIAMTAVLVSLWILINRTDLGQRMQAVGGNPEASRLSGIRVHRAKIAGFVISAICAGIAGILLSSRIGSAQITGGDGYLLDAFAACFLGSAALREGEFHIVGTLIGVLLVGVAFNGLAIIGAPVFTQYLFKGGLLIAAVALSTSARRYAAR